MSYRLLPNPLRTRYLSGNKWPVLFISIVIFCIISTASLFYLYKDFVYATGGAFPYTKHGGGQTDTETPCAEGVNRGLSAEYASGVVNCTPPDYPPTNIGIYYDDPLSEAGQYASSECTHCHEPHASFGGSEAPPNTAGTDEGPDTYLLMKEYGTAANYAELCWYCHDNMSNINGSGYGVTYGRWGFYQGSAVYQSSSHYTPPSGSFYWPGPPVGDPPVADPVAIWPRQNRFGLTSGNLGSCLNCHTPHGIMEDGTNLFDTGAVPANEHLAANNSSVTTDYLIPRQLIAWEEALCENCHDASGPAGTGGSSDIQSEINKRTTGLSGHPVDDTTYAGRHIVSEALPITTKHVECYDCHNPHADNTGNRLEGMKYIEIDGTLRDPANGDRQPYVYEVCIKCHGATHNTFIPDRTATGTGAEVGGTLRTTVAQYGCGTINPASQCTDGSDKRLEFDIATNSDLGSGPVAGGNRAYHPVAAAGRNTSTALNNQLLDGLDTSKTIQCTDCHNNNDTGAGTFVGMTATPTYPGPVTQSNTTRPTDVVSQYTGTEPVGPHGSSNVRILRANYNTSLGTTGSAPFTSFDAGNFALCFNCHNVQAFTDDDGIVGVQMTNFLQDAFGCRSPKRNLHATHLTDLSSSFPWGYINNMYTACANCHYNVHSNAEATNTLYGNGSGGGLPADGDTHLINFSPIVDSFNFSKPRWAYEFYFGSWYMRCNLKCHGAYMGYGSGFPSNADALYTRYPS